MNQKPTVMVSSTVYGAEELLGQVYSLLKAFKFEVWMSHKGTVPVVSNKTAFENCLDAVEQCDLFLGMITPWYGTGIAKGELSITHQEMRKAIELNKPRWFLAHDHVVFARQLLRDIGYGTVDEREKLTLKERASSISDMRVIQMYEDATLEQVPLNERRGNWVQKFSRDAEVCLFVEAQFSNYGKNTVKGDHDE